MAAPSLGYSRAAIQAAALLELRRRREEQQGETFRQFVDRSFRGFRWGEASELLAEYVGRWARRELLKLFIAAPPQIGKSTMIELGAAYYLAARPDLTIGVSSYAAGLAERRSRSVRRIYRRNGGLLDRERAAVREWATAEGGGLWAAGIEGGQTGFPANALIADDLVKNQPEGASRAIQERNNTWHGTSWLSRWNDHGGPLSELYIGTRWDVGDIGAYLLGQGGWTCLILPAIYEGPPEVPAGNILVPDWRRPGETIRPSETGKWSKQWLEEQKLNLKRHWWAIYQQQPKASLGGGLIRRGWFPILATDPALQPNAEGVAPGEALYAAVARSWDLAATEGGGDRTAGVKMGRLAATGRIVVRHCISVQQGPGAWKRLMASTMISDGPLCGVTFPVDPGQAGIYQAQELTQYLRDAARAAGMACPPIKAVPAHGKNKVERSLPFRSAAEPALDQPGTFIPGNIDLAAGTWNADYLDVLHDFDGIEGHRDDEVDASSDAYGQVAVPVGGLMYD